MGLTGAFSWGTVSQIQCFFEPQGGMPAAQDISLDVCNVAVTNGPDTVEEGSTPVDPGSTTVWNKNAARPEYGKLLTQPISLEGATHIAFDFYVSDLQALRGMANFDGPMIRFFTGEDVTDESRLLIAGFVDKLTQDGWNHVVIPIESMAMRENFDLANVGGYSVYYENANAIAPQAFYLGAMNIRALTITPEEGLAEGEIMIADCDEYFGESYSTEPNGHIANVLDFDNKTEGFASITNTLKSRPNDPWNNNIRVVIFDPVDITGTNVIKFDLYISDAEVYASTFAQHMYFLINGGDTLGYTPVRLELPDDLQQGWNEVTLSLAGTGLDPSAIGSVAIKTVGNLDGQGIGEIDGELTVKLDNVRAAYDESYPPIDSDPDPDPDPDPEPGEIPEEPDHSGEEGLFIAEGATFTWGPSLNPADPSLVHAGWVNQIYKLDEPIDISEYPYIQMDFYCSDWESLMAEPNFGMVLLRLYTADMTVEEAAQATDAQGVYKSVGLSAQEVDLEMKENGWATIKFYMGGLGVDTIYLIGSYMESNTLTKPSKDYILGYKNYYAVEETGGEEMPEGTAFIHKGDTFPRPWGPSMNAADPGAVNANWANVRYDPFRPVDITGTTDLEFDFYVDDWEALKNNPDFASVNLRLYYTANCIDSEQVTYGITRDDLDKLFAESEDGWVHVKLDIFGHTFNEVYGSMFFMEMNQAMKPTQDYQLQVKNIVVTTDPAVIPPEPPTEGTLLAEGEVFQWGPILGPNVNANWINKIYFLNDGNGMDFSKFTELQLDYMVSDWESLKALPNFGSINIRLITDPSDVNKFVQTGLTVEDLEEQGIKSGWNRLKFPMPEEEVGTVYQIMIFIEDNAKTTPDKNYRMGYVNIYGLETVIVDNTPVAPAVPDQPVRPDKDSVYISDCEGLIAGGTWGPNDLKVDTDAKTEGGASLYNIFHSELGTRGSALRLSIGENMNLTGAKELRFDMYISSVELLKSRTKMAVRLATDSRGNSEYIQWDIDKFGDLKDGWNSIVLSFSDISSEDEGFDIADIACFNLFCEEQNLEGEEMLRINVDNIRVFGADGALNDDDSPETGVPVALAPVALAALGLGAAIVFGKRKKTK